MNSSESNNSKDPRRAAARRTALLLAFVAFAIFTAFFISVTRG